MTELPELPENRKIRIGAVSYLNTMPLIYGLGQASPPLEVVLDLPSRLADRLANAELDVALVPVVEAVSNPVYTIVSDACIACRGPVGSVKLFSRVPFEKIERLTLDEGSRTSVILSKIILRERFGVSPVCEPLLIDQEWTETSAEAALVIGDRAMHNLDHELLASRGFEFEMDLGEYWNEWTGLPFVFAVWAARPATELSVDLQSVDAVLTAARDQGMASLDTICDVAYAERGFEKTEARDYLTNNLHFYLGELEKRGLQLFFEHAKRHNLLDSKLDLQFYDCQTAG